jgi:hypothetical protein
MVDSDIEYVSSKLERFPPINITNFNGLHYTTLEALKEASSLKTPRSNTQNSLPKLIRTTRREIPNSFNSKSLKLEFNYLGLPKMKDTLEPFTREEWIDILKENTPKSVFYVWDLLKLDECVMDNGVFNKEKINSHLDFYKMKSENSSL